MRTHIEWNVLTHIDRARGPTSAATRSFISPAALLVKVIARISPGLHPAFGEQVGDAAGQHPRLARAGARDDQQRAALVHDSRALLRVEPVEQGRRIDRDPRRGAALGFCCLAGHREQGVGISSSSRPPAYVRPPSGLARRRSARLRAVSHRETRIPRQLRRASAADVRTMAADACSAATSFFTGTARCPSFTADHRQTADAPGPSPGRFSSPERGLGHPSKGNDPMTSARPPHRTNPRSMTPPRQYPCCAGRSTHWTRRSPDSSPNGPACRGASRPPA